MTVNECDEMYEEKRELEYCTENKPVTSAYSVSIDSSISKEQSLGLGICPYNKWRVTVQAAWATHTFVRDSW